MNPRNHTSKPPVQQHQYQSDADVDQTVPFKKNVEEDWDSKHQKQFQQTNKIIQILDTQQKNTQNPQCTQDHQIPQNPQPTQTQCFDVPD